jgi:hypothetical protein
VVEILNDDSGHLQAQLDNGATCLDLNGGLSVPCCLVPVKQPPCVPMPSCSQSDGGEVWIEGSVIFVPLGNGRISADAHYYFIAL